MEKVAGAYNLADLGTKHLNAETMRKHLVRLGVRTSGGRAGSAPTLGTLAPGGGETVEENPRG